MLREWAGLTQVPEGQAKYTNYAFLWACVQHNPRELESQGMRERGLWSWIYHFYFRGSALTSMPQSPYPNKGCPHTWAYYIIK